MSDNIVLKMEEEKGEIDLRSKKLSTIPIDLIKKYACTISAGAFKDCALLQRLVLENNEINEIHQETFDGLNKLKGISLSNNKLCTIPVGAFKGCKALDVLWLNNNQINEIAEGTFKGCKALEWLMLNNNQINEIAEGTFKGLNQLTLIYLENNKLCTISAGAFKQCKVHHFCWCIQRLCIITEISFREQ